MSLKGRFYKINRKITALAAIFLVGALFLANSALATGEADYQEQARIVAIYIDGAERSIMTKAATVRQALIDSGVDYDENRDAIEPSLGTKISANDFKINVHRARVVTIAEGSRRIRVTTAAQTPAQIAEAAGIKIYREDEVNFSLSDDVALNSGILMTISRAKQRTVTVEEEIDFAVEQERDYNQPLGYKSVKQTGEKGMRKTTFVIDVEDGVEVSRRQVSSEITKEPKTQIKTIGAKPTNPLTKSKGAHIFTDSKGVAHRETYYDLPMNVVIAACGGGGYTVREDGAKVDKDGYILVAANYGNYPRCSVVETSMGPGKIYDTGGFATRHPHGFDLATDWTNGDGR